MATNGSNLTVWQNSAAYYFDPTAELPSTAANGQYIYVSSGTGFRPGLYVITATALNSSQPGTNANGHNLFSLVSMNFDGSPITPILLPITTVATTPQSGAVWGYGATPAAAYAAAAGSTYVPPTTTPNPSFTMALNGVKGGDSIAQYEGNLLETKLKSAFPNAAVSIFNAGSPGDTVEMYAPGHASGRLTGLLSYLTGSARGGVVSSFCHLTLGKNDLKLSVATSQSSFQTQMQALVDNLFSGAPALKLVVINEVTYTVPTTTDFNATANGIARTYNSGLLATTRASIITGLYDIWDNHPELIATDGIHPSTTPAANTGVPGTGPGYDALTAIEANQLQPLLVNLLPPGPVRSVPTAANLSADGKTLALTLSLPVAGPGIASDFVLSNAVGVSASFLSADGLTLTLSLRRRVFAAENPTLTYAGTSIIGINNLPLQPLAASAVTNGSTRRAFGPPAFLNVAYPGFTWPTVAGATGYRLYQNGILVYDTVNAAGANTLGSFTDPAAADGRPIDQPTFTVSAYDGTGEGPQSGTPDGTAAALFTQGVTSVTLTDNAVVNGQTVRLSGPQRVVVNDVRYDVPVGVAVMLPNSIRSVLQNANLIV